jgi:hypothetical protein
MENIETWVKEKLNNSAGFKLHTSQIFVSLFKAQNTPNVKVDG